jgi:tripartite-type tricarboxylate transporter receptor subunit TctC
MKWPNTAVWAVSAVFALSAAPLARAADFPAHAIRLIVSFPAGGPADSFGRVFAKSLSEQIGQPVIVENRAGVGGVIGADAVAKSAPDGYTLGVANGTPLTISPYILTNMAFDVQKDITPITLLARAPQVLAVRGNLNLKTLPDFVKYARAHPGKMNFGSGGQGALGHLAVALLEREAGIDLVHVPYKGGAPATQALVGGQVDLLSLDLSVLLPQIRAKTIVALAVPSDRRVPALADVPTTGEVGYPTVQADSWYGLIAPAGVAPEVLDKLGRASRAALASPEVQRIYAEMGAEAAPGSSADFRALIERDQKKWEPIIHGLDLKAE